MKLQGLKKVLYAGTLFCIIGSQAKAQQLKLGTNPTKINGSALLELESKKQALLLPRIPNITNIKTPVDGMIFYLESDNTLRVRTNGTWGRLQADALGSLNGDNSPSQTIKVAYTPGAPLGYTSSAGTHTLNIPDATLTNPGFVSTAAQSFTGPKIFTGAAANPAWIPLAVKAASTQTGNLTEWRSSADVPLSVIDKSGRLGLGTAAPAQTLEVKGTFRLTDDVTGITPTKILTKNAAGDVTGVAINSTLTLTGTTLGVTPYGTQPSNFVFAGQTSGEPLFRALAATDIPAGSGSYIQNNSSVTAQTADFNITGTGNAGKVVVNGSAGSTSGLKLTGLGTATPAAANTRVLSVNSTGDVIVTNNQVNNNWGFNGNSNIDSTVNFLGTTNQQALVLKYNNQELFRGTHGVTGYSSMAISLFNGALPFNGHPLIIRANGNDVLAFQDNTGKTKWHWNLLSGGLNFVETNIGDYRLFLQNGGNVGIGTSSPAALLDVNGSARVVGNLGVGTATPVTSLDVNGNTRTTAIGINTTGAPATRLDVNGNFSLGAGSNTLNNIIKTTATSGTGTVTINSGRNVIVNFTLATTLPATSGGNPSAIVNPQADLPVTTANEIFVAWARVSANNTVKICIANTGTGNYTLPANTIFDVTIIQ